MQGSQEEQELSDNDESENIDPWKQSEVILALFTEATEALAPHDPIETVVIDRITRQLTNLSQATSHLYRNAELMGISVWYNYCALKKLVSTHPVLSRLTMALDTVFCQLPNKVSVEYFVVRGEVQHQIGKDITLSSFIHFECEQLTMQLLDSECRNQQSDTKLRRIIDFMTQGCLPFRVTLRGLKSDSCTLIRERLFKQVYELTLRGSVTCQDAVIYINPKDLKKNIASAIQFVSSQYPRYYKKGGPEVTLIGFHLALLKELLDPKLLNSKTEYEEKVEFMRFFNYLYQFFYDQQLTKLLDQAFFGVKPYKHLMKFQFLALMDIKALACRKEYNYMIPDAKEFTDRIDPSANPETQRYLAISTLDSLFANIINMNPNKNPLKEMLSLVLIFQNFNTRIYATRKELSYDSFQWLLARNTAVQVQLIDFKMQLTKKGDDTYKETIETLIMFVERFNHLRNEHDYAARRNDPKLKEKLEITIGKHTLHLYCKLVDYWYGQWDNNEPLDFEQVNRITEKLVLFVLTKSREIQTDLVEDMQNILRTAVILEQAVAAESTEKDPDGSEAKNCALM